MRLSPISTAASVKQAVAHAHGWGNLTPHVKYITTDRLLQTVFERIFAPHTEHVCENQRRQRAICGIIERDDASTYASETHAPTILCY
ncbi:hypothetical protein [Chloroflexus islandicus]|uniref:hypothetical protein n=1 Tax=Chloroflexus islandicus TaxID=1707952 RepID=UPI0012E89772|nr:hypothetical protein [Chloroflexus islandicus]